VPEGTGPPHLSYSPEADANIKLLGDEAPKFDMRDATHKLTHSGLVKATGPEYSRPYRWTYIVLHSRQKLLVKAIVSIKADLRRIGVLSRADGLGDAS
jgi:hypothetical protein